MCPSHRLGGEGIGRTVEAPPDSHPLEPNTKLEELHERWRDEALVRGVMQPPLCSSEMDDGEVVTNGVNPSSMGPESGEQHER